MAIWLKVLADTEFFFMEISLRFLGLAFINFQELSGLLFDHGTAVSMDVPRAQGGWNDFPFSPNLETKQPEAVFCEHSGKDMKFDWLREWQTESTVSKVKVSSLPQQIPSEVLGVSSCGARDDLASRNNFHPVLVAICFSFSSSANLGSAQSLKLDESIQAVRIRFTSFLCLVQGFGLGWRKVCVQCSVNSILSECPLLSMLPLLPSFHSQSCCGVDDEEACLGNKLWLESSIQQDSHEVRRTELCIFTSPAAKMLPGLDKPALSANASGSLCT